ncbi:hypothetical protein LO80_03255 [Candidatus Francisella endociliophora]|uniref:Uncharacterized protein n=1 Tax=Candidatus Francisella endociliophora TaxID=653937 RepID=A0A097ENE6_9GAMM|nr:hypothetical protein [Francisella sp. FSC1006]AIT09085.1 hypothetical protein LO80_03255 [Francisella sp. FSC1006]
MSNQIKLPAYFKIKDKAFKVVHFSDFYAFVGMGHKQISEQEYHNLVKPKKAKTKAQLEAEKKAQEEAEKAKEGK